MTDLQHEIAELIWSSADPDHAAEEVVKFLGQREPAATMRPMSTAPKDGTQILAKTTGNHQHWPDRWFAIGHPGLADDGFDVGWKVFPGWGCFDDAFEGWIPIPFPAPPKPRLR